MVSYRTHGLRMGAESEHVGTFRVDIPGRRASVLRPAAFLSDGPGVAQVPGKPGLTASLFPARCSSWNLDFNVCDGYGNIVGCAKIGVGDLASAPAASRFFGWV